jgi:hypothetical protein
MLLLRNLYPAARSGTDAKVSRFPDAAQREAVHR